MVDLAKIRKKKAEGRRQKAEVVVPSEQPADAARSTQDAGPVSQDSALSTQPSPDSAKLERFMAEEVDAEAIDEKGEYDYSLFDGFNKLGAWGMKIPKEYGGLGFSSTNYNRAIGFVAT